jgi:hypothetical protein
MVEQQTEQLATGISARSDDRYLKVGTRHTVIDCIASETATFVSKRKQKRKIKGKASLPSL